MDNAKFYVGISELNDLLEIYRAGNPLFLATYNETSDFNGITRVKCFVSVMAIQDGICRYWRMRTGGYLHVGAGSLDPIAQKAVERTQSALSELKQVLAQRCHTTPENGIIAAPESLRLLDGSTCLLRLDPNVDRYISVSDKPEQSVG